MKERCSGRLEQNRFLVVDDVVYASGPYKVL